MSDVSFAFNLAPEKAIEFLKQKRLYLNGVDIDELQLSARGRAAKIANLTSLEMMQDIYQSLIDAKAEGKAFGEWRKGLLAHLDKKGWLHTEKVGRKQKTLIADPKTGEVFGTPWRLNTIYRTNVQAAYSAQRYQQQRDNALHRPYWQYSAVGDSRTRPSHAALNGKVYRYDDPFWRTFYPPNGFNCRCSVIALSQRQVDKENITVETAELEEYINEKTDYRTTGVKVGDRVFIADKGFDYHAGRSVYKPNLDRYPEQLAHQFAKREMSGESFKLDYQQLQRELTPYLAQLAKLTGTDKSNKLVEVRNLLRKEYKFAAGVLSETTQEIMQTPLKTVWLSDDSLIKQIVNRESQAFTADDYAILPDILYQPTKVVEDNIQDNYRFYHNVNGKKMVIVIKVLRKTNEIFLQSFRQVSEKQWKKVFE
ncbi:phage minor head protein [Gallibacterium sp. AGMB14963]|uniref:phage minor head protein n=1 Tax=Gallibacterium faecale TaxID=3019086 RepID=UPI0022F17CED|nr:phage minor head protein [Gallibacterium sp. AGMB14963]MDA3978479.1 phage minor head protein [Gallibacterium sp. AGMB14963]